MVAVPVTGITCYTCTSEGSPACSDQASAAGVECPASPSCMETTETTGSLTTGGGLVKARRKEN